MRWPGLDESASRNGCAWCCRTYQAALACQHAAQVLGPRPVLLDAVEVLDAFVVVLVGLLLAHVLSADCLVGGEVAVGGVDVVVVVDCGGADVLV